MTEIKVCTRDLGGNSRDSADGRYYYYSKVVVVNSLQQLPQKLKTIDMKLKIRPEELYTVKGHDIYFLLSEALVAEIETNH